MLCESKAFESNRISQLRFYIRVYLGASKNSQWKRLAKYLGLAIGPDEEREGEELVSRRSYFW